MSDLERDDASPEEQLERLQKAKNDAIGRCYDRTASRIAAELKRAARAARKLEPYVWALHTIMVNANDLLDPEQGREAAIELIAVLESEDRARQIQPDLELGRYEWLVATESSCAYDNLARATAEVRGYNSEGLHEAVAEGIQVCRRTGKLECINCFRQYASDVFRAADDLPMALHHARQIIEKGGTIQGFDRRWTGAHDESEFLLVMGRVDAAEEAALRAWSFAGAYHSPLSARLWSADVLATARYLKGEEATFPELEGYAELATLAPPPEESPKYHLRHDLALAVESSMRGDHNATIRALTTWDRKLTERQCLDQWFEVRLRLIAAHLMAGDDRRAEALAKQLEAKASDSRDWLALRRLARLRDPSVPVSPTAPAGPIVLATSPPPGPAPAGSLAAERTPDAGLPSADEQTPLEPMLDQLAARRMEHPDDETVKSSVLDELLAIGPDRAIHPADVARMIAMARDCGDDASRGPAVWDWAEAIAAPFPREAVVLSCLGALGETLRNAEGSQVVHRIDEKRIEQLFRESLDLDPYNPANFGRAAVHYDSIGRTSEAERCLARCVRLDRNHAGAALWLAEIYQRTDRASDALAVLDMALRSGADNPDVAWQAGLLAHSQGQYESMLTYLDQFESVVPGRTWLNFYRASGLTSLGRHAEALEALDEEERRYGERPLQVRLLRASVLAALGHTDEFRGELAAILSTRLSETKELNHNGLLQLFGRLWVAANVLTKDEPLLARLIDRLLETGLAPNELFEPDRTANPKTQELNYYVCIVLQPLDDRWRDSPGCLPGEMDWTAYRVPWGVLAPNEHEASAVVLAWQSRCYPVPATVEEVQLREEGYHDHPGVVWQGLRSAVEDDPE
jgi:tetratricopeptide (TPR) repeat protein